MAIRVERPPGPIQHTVDAIQRVSFFPGVVEEAAGEYRILRPFYEVDLPDLQLLLGERLHSQEVFIEADGAATRVYRAQIGLRSLSRRVDVRLNLGENVAYGLVTAAASLWEFTPRAGKYRRLRFRPMEEPGIALSAVGEYVDGMFNKILQVNQIKPL